MPRIPHDTPPPPQWPPETTYLHRARLEKTFPADLVPLLFPPSTCTASSRFTPQPTPHPPCVLIKRVNQPSHPAHGQRCLVAKKAIEAGVFIMPYLGEVHATFTKAEGADDHAEGSDTAAAARARTPPPQPSHETSDYDLSLLRLSAFDARNPYPGYHVSIGVDAAAMGNAARFVNDYRGCGAVPNAEFRTGRGAAGELRMEVWSLRAGVGRGEEVLVSYGKGWWRARTGG